MSDFLLVALIGGGLSVVVWIGCGISAALTARRWGARLVNWLFFGALLGPVALYLVHRVLNHSCPHCQAPVLRAVRICPGCGSQIPRLEHNPVGPFWTYRRDW